MKLECQTVLITWGSFLNYVEQILPIINHLPFGEGIPLLLHIGGNLPIVDIFPYLPRLSQRSLHQSGLE